MPTECPQSQTNNPDDSKFCKECATALYMNEFAFPIKNLSVRNDKEDTMKAIVCTKYGPPDVLQLKEVAKPTPKDNEILVKVHAASVNDWDWGLLRGTPFVNRLMFGILKPRTWILGCDIAGRVEAVGRNVKQFQPGDEVFGDISGCGWGGFAEYVCARENALVLKPVSMTFRENQENE